MSKIAKKQYPRWAKVLWHYVRVFFASFFGVFSFQALLGAWHSSDLLLTLVESAVIAGIAAVFKALREGAGKNYDSLIHRFIL